MYSTQGAAIKAKKKAKREKEKRLETAETLQGKPQVNLNLQTPLLHRHPRRLHKTILRGGARNDVEFFKNEQPFLSESFFPLSFPYHRSLSLSLSLSLSVLFLRTVITIQPSTRTRYPGTRQNSFSSLRKGNFPCTLLFFHLLGLYTSTAIITLSFN